jgi:endonuclease I/V8-like Glu-specific endopeptidase
MSTAREQQERADRRFRQRTAVRTEKRHELKRLGHGGDWRKVEDPLRLLRRAASLDPELAEAVARSITEPAPAAPPVLAGARAVPAEAIPPVPPVPLAEDPLERVIGAANFLGARFLFRGARAARAVGRVQIRRPNGAPGGYGTGFMVSPRLLLTNNHVLGSAPEAQASLVQFNYYEIEPGRISNALSFPLDPATFYLTNEALDYTLVAVAPRSGSGADLAERGWLGLVAESGKALVGEMVNIIQYPEARPQEVVLHENELADVLDDFLHYLTDTQPGSSGSPVLNNDWRVAALHHAGVPERDAQGRIIRWVANEGVRISSIVRDVRARRAELSPAQQALFEACLAPMTEPLEQDGPPVAGPPGSLNGSRNGGTWIDADGRANWTVPVIFSVGLGELRNGLNGHGAAAPVVVPAPAVAPGPPPSEPALDQDALRQALNAIEDHADEPYYNQAQDEADRAAYYPAKLADQSAAARFRALSDLLRQSHARRIRYDTARLRHLYPWVDLHEDRQLASIYSGKGFAPEALIEADLRVDAQRELALQEALAAEAAPSMEQLTELMEAIEATLPYNCEHVVPQSWFATREPMRGDLHHLFACESRCNSFRSNTPYWEFPPVEKVRAECGQNDGAGTRFEPEAGKGAVARATLYFLLRYPGLVGNAASELQPERLKILLAWHARDGVSDYERHRNAAIFRVQGNRNPLIDHPGWATEIDFRLGFGAA